MKALVWHKAGDGAPKVGADVIGLNYDTGEMEFGFRSEVDFDLYNWVDFSFPLTHWAHASPPKAIKSDPAGKCPECGRVGKDRITQCYFFDDDGK